MALGAYCVNLLADNAWLFYFDALVFVLIQGRSLSLRSKQEAMKRDTYKIVKADKGKREGIPTFSVSGEGRTLFFDIAHYDDVAELYWETINGLHSHDFYIMIWFSKGSGRQIVDSEMYDVADNMIICLSPSRIHQFIDVRNFEGFAVIFSKGFLRLLSSHLSSFLLVDVFNSIGKPFVRKMGNVSNSLCLDYLNKLNSEFANHHSDDNFESVKCLFSLFCIQLRRELGIAATTDSYARDIYNRFMVSLEDYYLTMHHVKEYASELNVSTGELNRCCVAIVGKKAVEIINERLATEAYRMLKAKSDVKMSVEQIARYLGFTDSSNFSKFFRKHTGMCPRLFRAMDLSQIIEWQARYKTEY